jgi:hypothetical protein
LRRIAPVARLEPWAARSRASSTRYGESRGNPTKHRPRNEALLEWQAAVDAGEDMRVTGAVQELERRCAAFAAWSKTDEADEMRESGIAFPRGA